MAVERNGHTNNEQTRGLNPNLLVDVAAHFLLVEPRSHTMLLEPLVHEPHSLVVVAPQLVRAPVMRQEYLRPLRGDRTFRNQLQEKTFAIRGCLQKPLNHTESHRRGARGAGAQYLSSPGRLCRGWRGKGAFVVARRHACIPDRAQPINLVDPGFLL